MRQKIRSLTVVVSSLDNTCGAGNIADARWIMLANSHPFIIQSGVAVQNNDKVFGVIPANYSDFKLMLAAYPAEKSNNFTLKVGLICDAQQINDIANLAKVASFTIVDTPVISTSGWQITSDKIAAEIFEKLLPNATLFTPNTHEIAYFGGLDKILKSGVQNVLLKSINPQNADKYKITQTLSDKYTYDILLNKAGEVVKIYKNRTLGLQKQVRGTGCALSSLIAGFVAGGVKLEKAVYLANKTLHKKLTKRYYCFGGADFLPL